MLDEKSSLVYSVLCSLNKGDNYIVATTEDILSQVQDASIDMVVLSKAVDILCAGEYISCKYNDGDNICYKVKKRIREIPPIEKSVTEVLPIVETKKKPKKKPKKLWSYVLFFGLGFSATFLALVAFYAIFVW